MLNSVYAVLGVCWTRCMLYWVYATLGVCCTWCMLYSVYAVFGVCWTRGMLYSVYAVLGVCCTPCMLYSVYAELGVCCTRCMLYSVNAVLGVNLWSGHGDIERDDLPLGSGMMVELWTRQGEMGDDDGNHVENLSGYQKSGVRLAWLRGEYLIRVLLHTGSVFIPAVSEMVSWPAHDTPWGSSFSWWFPASPLISLFLVLNPPITKIGDRSRSLNSMMNG